MGYTIEPQSKEEYFFQLQNAKKLGKLNNHQIELAKTFIFIQQNLTRVPTSILDSREINYIDEKVKYLDERIFWTGMIKLLDQYKYEEDLLIKMMKIQAKNNDMHIMNYRMLEKTNLDNALTKLSEDQNP